MTFNLDEIKKILEGGTNRTLEPILMYQSILRVFTEAKDFRELQDESGWSLFKDRFSITDSNKRERLMESVSLPLASVDLTKSCANVVDKLWEAKNRYFDAETTDSLKEEIAQSEPYEFIKTKAKHTLTNAPNAIIWVDYDEEGNPKYKYVPFECVKDYKVCKKNPNELEYLAYEVGNKCYWLDGTQRYVFEKNENNQLILIDEVIRPESMERNPARFFLDEMVNSDSDKRESLFTNALGEISDYELFAICHTYTEMYGAFPVIQMPESKCSIEGCEGGVINRYNEEAQTWTSAPCTSCKDKKNILAGTTIQIPAGLDTDMVSPVDVFKFIDPDVKGLTYIKERQQERRNNIYYTTAGVNAVTQKEAVNEDQVQAGFESQKDVLLNIKGQLERLYSWMVNTVIWDNTGSEAEVAVNFGTEFFLYNESQIQQLMIQAKDAGTPENEVEEIYKQLVQTKYKGNAYKEKRAFILNEVNPFPFDTIKTMETKQAWGAITAEDLFLWSNFTNLIKRYERENGDVTLSTPDQITAKLKSYIDESKQSNGSEEQPAE